MELLIVFAQPLERYEGEWAPVALDVVTEYDYEENPDYINSKAIEAKASGEYESVEIIKVEVSMDAVMDRLRPNRKAIPGKI